LRLSLSLILARFCNFSSKGVILINNSYNHSSNSFHIILNIEQPVISCKWRKIRLERQVLKKSPKKTDRQSRRLNFVLCRSRIIQNRNQPLIKKTSFSSSGCFANLKSRYEVSLSLLRPDQISCVPTPVREIAQQLLAPGKVEPRPVF